MATVQIEVWHLVTLLLSVLGGFWTLAKVIASQFQVHTDAAFSQINSRLEKIEQASREDASNWQRAERELLLLKAELPQMYVRRDDFVQAIGGISTRIDNFALRMERALDNTRNGGPL